MRTMTFIRDNARWLTVGVVLTFLSSFGQTFFISIFAGEIRAEYGLSHGDWGAVYAAGTLGSAAVMLWLGLLSDRLRVRVLGPLVLAGLAGACLWMAGNRAGWALPLVIFALRLGGQGMATHVARVAMARWFVAARGRALALATMGFALGEALLPVAVVLLMAAVSWRAVWLVAALATLALIPLVARLLRRERTPQAHAADGTAAGGLSGRHWTRPEVLRGGLFWALLPSLLAPPAFNTAFFFQQVHLCQTKGWDHLDFVALIPVYTGVSLVAMLGAGWAIDRWGSWRWMPLYQLPFAAAFVVLGAGDSLAALFVVFVLIAVMQGGGATLPAAFWAETFGTAHLGAIKALASAVMVLGSALGPGLTGALIDAGIPFEDQAPWIGLFILVASGLAALGQWRARHLRWQGTG